ncbi:isochorismate synthase [Tengunoibacter tsumagoiensis]|uniref:isochorismate synthase n=1 Tax=Tengunoibacter tsumagoiensis TaxID=2014871 RepID=A0A402A8X6_9CHLR|nr:isochorismate synthase [Tengunoibacter tsumagoiensis]GCE15612.1 isochorismate synthase [Tengunoibacter tsumagoiensis]
MKVLPGLFQDTLLRLLQQAHKRAEQHKKDILISLTVPITVRDGLTLFSSNRYQQDSQFFWEHPQTQRTLVGIGCATRIQLDGGSRFQAVNAYWKELLQHAVIQEEHTLSLSSGQAHISGPILFGGFAFHETEEKSALWEGFPGASFVVPLILFSTHKEDTTVTFNYIVKPDTALYRDEDYCVTIFSQLLVLQEETYTPGASHPERELLIKRDKQFLTADDWKQLVSQSVQSIRQGEYQKIVLARGIKIELQPATERFNIGDIVNHLRHHHSNAYIFALQHEKRYFCGATPELLINTHNGTIHTMALAGSAPRGQTLAEDQNIAMHLLQSKKLLEEHRFVVSAIYQALQPLCASVSYSENPEILRLENVQHLITPLAGKLLPMRTILDLVEALHPTPAVGGLPQKKALEIIRQEEKLDRGWYASPIGWLDAYGNGEFAVALRSSLIDGQSATLFAGCGIVADSDPEEEYKETCWKFQAMMNSLGVGISTLPQQDL